MSFVYPNAETLIAQGGRGFWRQQFFALVLFAETSALEQRDAQRIDDFTKLDEHPTTESDQVLGRRPRKSPSRSRYIGYRTGGRRVFPKLLPLAEGDRSPFELRCRKRWALHVEGLRWTGLRAPSIGGVLLVAQLHRWSEERKASALDNHLTRELVRVPIAIATARNGGPVTRERTDSLEVVWTPAERLARSLRLAEQFVDEAARRRGLYVVNA